MKEVENPCKDCPERSVGCHGSCDRYAEWLKCHIDYKHERFEQTHPEIEQYIRDRHYPKQVRDK